MHKRRMIATFTTGVALAIGFAAPALAGSWTDSRDTAGAAATCTMTTWDDAVSDQYASIGCNLTDTACDSHSVYIEWWQDGYAKVRLNNTDGCNTTNSPSDTRYNDDGSFGTVYWRVCRDVQLGRDNCSSTVSHRTH
jgi:hypothetical protein